MAIVHFDPDPGDRPTVVTSDHETRSVERRQPRREVVVLLVEPLAEIGEAGVDPPGGAKHACPERRRPDPEYGAEPIAETRRVETVGELRGDGIDAVRRDRDHRTDPVADTLERSDDAIPGRTPTGWIADDVHPRAGRRPPPDPRSEVRIQSGREVACGRHGHDPASSARTRSITGANSSRARTAK